MNRVYLVLICLCCAFCARSQVVAVKTNVLYDVTTTFNLGAEVAFDKHLSLDISGNYNPWTLPDDNPLSTGSYNRSCAIGCMNGLTDIFWVSMPCMPIMMWQARHF